MDPATAAAIAGGLKGLGQIGSGIALGVAASKIYDQSMEGIAQAKIETPSETAYRDRLKKETTEGDPLFGEQKREILGDIRQQGYQGQQAAISQAIGQGLENSIVAQELRRRANLDTLKQVSKVSKDLAMRNAQYKRDAQTRLDSFNMQRDAMLRSLTMKETEAGIAQTQGIANAWSTAMGGAAQGAGSAVQG